MNADFDFAVYEKAFHQDLPIQLPLEIKQWKNIQVPLAKFSLPQSLENAALTLGTKATKDPAGKLYIKKCCKPNTTEPGFADFVNLFDYCIRDVEASFDVLKACPSISVTKEEWQLWRITNKMNKTGLPIQFDAVKAIKERADGFKEMIASTLGTLTNGFLTKPTQTMRIRDYLISRGVKVENVTAATVEALLEKDEKSPFLPSDCRVLLEARAAAGMSSVAKFDKLLDMRVGERVHDFLRYGGTNTLRWSGSGYQIHSLPRASVKDPDALIDKFLNMEDIENPIKSAKALCRSVILAPPGQMLYQGDYSSIEYLLLIWITDMQEKLQMFKDGKSAYIDMAASLFNKKYEEIDKHAKDNYEYFLGKQIILGCGYQMRAKKFKETCEKYNVTITDATATAAINSYDQVYAPIVKMWKDLHNACVAAIRNNGVDYKVVKCSIKVAADKSGTKWLIIRLPSGSSLYYHSPTLVAGTYGPTIKHMGLYQNNWLSRYLSPGRITENIIQKLARDLIGNSMIEISEDTEFTLLIQAHDELAALGSDKNPKETHKHFIDLMEKVPKWAETIPLKAAGYYGKRYKKD
jgi:DNA polymerase